MKKCFGAVLVTLLVMVVALGSSGLLSDFEPLAPLATFESDVEAMLAPAVAPTDEQMFVSTTLADELVTSDAISLDIYVVVLGTSALGLTLVLIWMMAKPRSARRQDSGSGRVVIHDKTIFAASPSS